MRFTPDDLCQAAEFETRHLPKATVAELKMNGIRLLVSKRLVGGDVVVSALSREGKSDYWPKLEAIQPIRDKVLALPHNTVLDCELHIPGVPETSIKTYMNDSNHDLVLSPFAVPVLQGEDNRAASLDEVGSLIAALGFTPPERILGPFDTGSVERLLAQASSRSIEGWVLKGAHYHSWFKLKPVKTVDCIVTGILKGEGKHAYRMGAIEVGLWDDSVGAVSTHWSTRVGTGFTDADRDEIWANQAQYLNKVVEVSYDSLAANGALKFPRFKRFRDDKAPKSCSMKQIQA